MPPSASHDGVVACSARSRVCDAEKEPGEQSVGIVAPDGHAEPAGHSSQSACAAPPPALRKLPAAQFVGALAPEGQYDPPGHSAHAVCPLADWYVPAAHASHALWPGAAA